MHRNQNPIPEAIIRFAELRMFVDITINGFIVAGHADLLTDRLKAAMKVTNKIDHDKKIDEVFRHILRAQDFAQVEINSGYRYLFALGSLQVWSILEYSITEHILMAMDAAPEVTVGQEMRRLKGHLIEYSESPPENRNEYLLGLLTNELRSRLRNGVNRFESLLEAVSLGGAVDETVKTTLFELSEIRNALIHRGPITDSRLIKNCPWLNFELDQPMKLTLKHFQRYSMAAIWYLLEILMRSRVLDPKAAQWDPDTIQEEQKELLEGQALALQRLVELNN